MSERLENFPVWNLMVPAQSFYDAGAGSVGCISLTCRQLYGNSVSHSNLIFDVAFLRMVGMDGVSHV